MNRPLFKYSIFLGVKLPDLSILDESIEGLEDLMIHHHNDKEFESMLGKTYRHEYKRFILLYSQKKLKELLESGFEKEE